MVKLICPGCNRKINSYEVECPLCGFSIKEYLEEINISDYKKKILCTKCGNDGNENKKPVTLVCRFCNIPMSQSEYSTEEFAAMYIASLEGGPEKVKENLGIDTLELERMIHRHDPRILEEMTKIKGGNPYAVFLKEQFPGTFEFEAFDRRNEQVAAELKEANTIRCPRCGSTDIRRRQGLVNSDLGLYEQYYICYNCFHTFRTP